MIREELLRPAMNIWLQTCPHCQQTWLIGETRENEAYRCKSCGHDFIVSHEHVPEKQREPSRH
jgi:transposase-like protein